MARETSIDSILDVLELIERIERQTANLTRETFIADADVQDATAYRILAIGEASKLVINARKMRSATFNRTISASSPLSAEEAIGLS